jgi:hypothetical protein
MNPDIKNEHAIETYKSLINISVAGLKLLALLNGGAVVALLAFIGNISGKGLLIPDMRLPMGCFLAGLAFCSFALLLSYWTQFILYQEIFDNLGKQGRNFHVLWHRLALILAILGLVAFVIGSFWAVTKLQNICPYPPSKIEKTSFIKKLKAES